MRSGKAASFLLVLSAFFWTVALAGPASATAKNAEPVPIPGGLDLGGGNVIHTYAPGPEDAGLGLTGVDSEPSTITNFNGLSGYALFVGSATDADGNPYDAVLDMRVFDGEYVGADGAHHHGTFGFI
ncbi:MAG: hypothetical protein E6G68_02590 [Actinobacteria bacterium]|nr:MAG: hypothetical protein E6G68_02590 [Actinomycetota bacterium]